MAAAYGQLVAEGWLAAEPGSGTRVADRAAPGAAATSSAQRGGAAPALRPAAGDARPVVVPAAGVARCCPPVAQQRCRTTCFDYPDPRGRVELRTALTDYLSRTRGVRVTPDRIVIVAGFAQGFGLLARVLRGAGRDDPGHGGVRPCGAARLSWPTTGSQVTAVPVDGHGAVIDELGDADAVMLTPAHQFPLGVALTAARRTRALEWAMESGGVIIEDDYDGEFRYDRQPLGAMQALGPEQVVYAGTASKSLAPGLRLGWLVLPADLVDEVVAAKARPDWQSGALEQLTLAEFITSGAYDRHLRRSRLAYRRRRDRLVSALQQQAPGVKITGIAAGLHALVELPAGWREDETVAAAAQHGVAVGALSSYSHVGARRSGGTRRRLRHPARARVHRRHRATLRCPRDMSDRDDRQVVDAPNT